MKIVNKVLVSVDASDLVDGVFYNEIVIEIANNCFLNIKNLKEINLPKVKKIGNNCFSYCDALTTVNVPVLAECGNNCFSYCDALTTVNVRNKKYNTKNVDGYCFVIEKQKTTKGTKIYEGYNFLSMKNKVIQKQPCFVSEKDGFTAHGYTVKKSISDLQFKIVADKLKKEPINADTVVSINHYRLITGACEFGCKSWLEQNGLTETEEMRADKLLPMLQKTGAWGYERFKQLVTF